VNAVLSHTMDSYGLISRFVSDGGIGSDDDGGLDGARIFGWDGVFGGGSGFFADIWFCKVEVVGIIAGLSTVSDEETFFATPCSGESNRVLLAFRKSSGIGLSKGDWRGGCGLSWCNGWFSSDARCCWNFSFLLAALRSCDGGRCFGTFCAKDTVKE